MPVLQETVKSVLKELLKVVKGCENSLKNEGKMEKNIVARGEKLHEIMTLWRDGVALIRTGYVLQGKAIHHLRIERLWQEQGCHGNTFRKWVENTLHISVAQAYRLEQIYREVGHILANMSIGIDISKVTLLLPHLVGQSDERKTELLLHAAECTIEGVKNNIKDMTGCGAQATDVCLHEDTELFNRCKNCGKFFR